MKKYNIYVTAIVLMAFVALPQACSVEPEYFSQATPGLFFDTQSKVYQRMGRPFTHWAWAVADDQAHSALIKLQEFTTDEMLIPARYNDWYDGGAPQRMYTHDFTPTTDGVNDAWRAFSMGVAQTWSAKEDIDEYADFEALGFEAGARDAILMQLQTLAAFFYLHGLDLFGGVPLYTTNKGDALPRSTAEETFTFIEGLLKEALPKLPKKTELGAMETGSINQAAAAMLLARLYFNAVPYINKEMFTECATICQAIINNEYGSYALEDDWRDVFGFDNDRSTEIIWSVPSEYAVSERSVSPHSSPYNMNSYWDNGEVGDRNNGYCLVPSLDAEGKSYVPGSSDPSAKGTFRLGNPFAKFRDEDVRKQLYAYEGEGKWRGMFLFGKLVNPVTDSVCRGGGRQVKPTDTLVLVDQIAILTAMYNASKEQTNTAIFHNEGARWGEEGSGVRLAKFSPIPTKADMSYRGKPDIPVLRLAETYYMLAECKLRAGDKNGAATLINEVRERYFTSADPDPVSASNLDDDGYRMLDEWMIEFIGEGRRRTDLVRWDKYTTEAWWDKPADNKPHFNRFPIPEQAMSGNNLIKQNPGY